MNKTFTEMGYSANNVNTAKIDLVKETSLPSNLLNNEVSDKIDFDDYFVGGVLQRNAVNNVYGTLSETTSKVYCRIQNKVYEGYKTSSTFEVYLPPLEVGGPYKLEIFTDTHKQETEVYVGDVYIVSGQSNNEWTNAQCNSQNTKDAINNANSDYVRLLKLQLNGSATPLYELKGQVKWTRSEPNTVRPFSCIGYQFAKYLQEKINIPVGVVSVAVGGCTISFFQSAESIGRLEEQGVDYKSNFTDHHWQNYNIFSSAATYGYNALIHPLLRHSFRGVLWNQGSSDAEYYRTYKAQYVEMIRHYREAFQNPELFFVGFELNRWGEDYTVRGQIGLIMNEVAREIPNTCVISSCDLGDFFDIHPADKTELCIRAAEEVAFSFYGIEREKQYLELDYIEDLGDRKSLKLHFKGVGEGIVYRNVLSSLEISENAVVYEHPETFVLGRDYIIIEADYPIKALRYGLGCYSPITQEMKQDTQLQMSLYNTENRPLRMLDIKF